MEQIGKSSAVSVVHVITGSGPHPYFRTLIEAGGLDPRALHVGCVGAAGALQEDMRRLGVPTFALGAGSRSAYPLAAARLARLLRRLGADVVQTHLVDGSLVGLSAARLARTPVSVMTAHHSHELPFHGSKLVLTERMCAGRLSDHVIAPSHAVARTLMRIGHVPADKIEVVHHGFDLDRLDPQRIDASAVRRELRLEGKIVFGAIGRIFRLKNYPALLRAFASALTCMSEARLVIVGPGDPSALESQAAALGIADRVLLCGQRPDIPAVLASFDVFVHPAIAESFGMVIVEAMAMARPVLSAPVGIAPEVIRSGEAGVLAASSDAASLARGLREMMQLRPQWARMGAAARELAKDFSAVRMASQYTDLYQKWLCRSAR